MKKPPTLEIPRWPHLFAPCRCGELEKIRTALEARDDWSRMVASFTMSSQLTCQKCWQDLGMIPISAMIRNGAVDMHRLLNPPPSPWTDLPPYPRKLDPSAIAFSLIRHVHSLGGFGDPLFDALGEQVYSKGDEFPMLVDDARNQAAWLSCVIGNFLHLHAERYHLDDSGASIPDIEVLVAQLIARTLARENKWEITAQAVK